jgi:hypothetical protein
MRRVSLRSQRGVRNVVFAPVGRRALTLRTVYVRLGRTAIATTLD